MKRPNCYNIHLLQYLFFFSLLIPYFYRISSLFGSHNVHIPWGAISPETLPYTSGPCREMGTSRTLKDISSSSNIKRKDIARYCRLLIRELEIKVPIVDAMKCIARVANTAQISEKSKRHAFDMMTEVIRREIPAGKHPMSLAATILYIACRKTGEDRTKVDIAKAAGITEVTIRNRFKDLAERNFDLD
jgi:transcription initiation factor TFIIIB Brf1 subunit/transcription initiation factor TFIIB